jgi:quinol monooxygenase YgiN
LISLAAHLKFASEDRTEVADALRQLAAATRQEPGCVAYLPHQSEDDMDTFVVYEQWADGKALAAHRASEHFKKYAVGCVYQKMRERLVENLTALV